MTRPRHIYPWLAAALCGVVLVACARLVPVVEQGVTVASDRHGTTQQAGPVTITVRLSGWGDDPIVRLEPYVTPFYIEIHNGGAEPVPFSVGDVALVDDEDTLFRPLPPERLEALLSHPVSSPVGPDGGLSGHLFDPDLAATLGALSSGPVLPGTRVRGAVYFQSHVDWARGVAVRVTVGDTVREFRFRER